MVWILNNQHKNNHLVAKYWIPYNFALGIRGGTNFIYNTISCEIEKYILSVEQASMEFGADGAFFVYLRKKPRASFYDSLTIL